MPVLAATYIDPRGCPSHWEMRLSKEGDVYFANTQTSMTSWIDPRGLQNVMGVSRSDEANSSSKQRK